MKHLFILNPMAAKLKGNIDSFLREIHEFFRSYPQDDYDIHITRWSRDAVGYTRRYAVNANELVRVYAFGGTGTLFEVINGVIGLPNVQIANFPLGRCNGLVRYFGDDKKHMFMSLRNLVFSNVVSIDAIRCGSNYGVGYGAVGIESITDRRGDELIERTGLPTDFCYYGAAIMYIIKSKSLCQSYKVTLDGKVLDGKYASILIANMPCYGKDMMPAVDAHPNDGVLDIYSISDLTKMQLLKVTPAYTSGNYKKAPDYISHRTGETISISSEAVMCASLDGEVFYDTYFEFDVIPRAIDFVCPNGIDIRKLPRIFNRPETIPGE